MLKNVVKAYWPSFRKYWRWWAMTMVAMIINVALHALSPYYLRGIVETFTSGAPDMELAQQLFLNLMLVAVGLVLSGRCFSTTLAVHESYAMADLDKRSFGAIQRQSMKFFEDTYAGSLVTRARRFRSSYEHITDLFFFQFGKNAVMLIVITVAFISQLPALTLPFLLWAAVFVVYAVGTTWWKFPYDKKEAEADSKTGAALADSLTNHLAVKMFGQEAAEERRFAAVVNAQNRARLKSWLMGDLLMVGQVLIMAAGEMALIGWLISGWGTTVSAGDFVFAQSFVIWVMSNLWPFAHNLMRLFAAIADAGEMAAVYQLVPEVRDGPTARGLFITEGEVEFHSIGFQYGSEALGSKEAISDLRLTIPPGQSVGIVGRSGAGKSTLVKLLLRFYDLDCGYIRIDRQDLVDFTQISLRQQLAAVPQQPQLLHRTIRDNISFARPDATDDEIIEAAKQAHAWEFIEALPKGLDTFVGERGVKLSGGEQQRIAIARAILVDPKILILDEATSSLDSETEKLIQKAISNLLHGRTAVVIAHRLSTIMQLDRIVVMEDGRIVEEGTHQELLERNGVYANLWAHQRGGYIA